MNAGDCATATTTVTNCAVYATATTCSMCAAGYYFNGTTCPANPTTVANCGSWFTDGNCNGCKNGFRPTNTADSGTAAAGAQTGPNDIKECRAMSAGAIQTKHTNCEVVNLISTYAAAATIPAVTEIGCKVCNSGYYLQTPNVNQNHATDSPCFSATGDLANCVTGTASKCNQCRWGFYQAEYQGKCTTVTTGKYSAILSVVSMIVALMFANF